MKRITSAISLVACLMLTAASIPAQSLSVINPVSDTIRNPALDALSKPRPVNCVSTASFVNLNLERFGLGGMDRPKSDAISQQVAEAYGKLPLSFEANQGQTDGQVKFLSHGRGSTLFLTASEAVLVIARPTGRDAGPGARIWAPPLIKERLLENPTPISAEAPPTVLRMQLVDANTNPQVVGLEELPGKINYFLGNDPQQWRTNVPTYAKVHYTAVYPGVDWSTTATRGSWNTTFASPPEQIPTPSRCALKAPTAWT